MKALLIAVVVAGLFAGCSGAVTLRHPITGQTATCGPYVWLSPAVSAGVPSREGRCISDFQRQGFERVPD